VVSRKQQVEAIDVARVRDANCADERLSNAKRVAGNHLGFCRIKPEDSCIPWERAGPDEYCDLLEMCFWIHGDECVAQFDGASEIAALSGYLCPQQCVIGALVEQRGESVQVAMETWVIGDLVTFLMPTMSVISTPP